MRCGLIGFSKRWSSASRLIDRAHQRARLAPFNRPDFPCTPQRDKEGLVPSAVCLSHTHDLLHDGDVHVRVSTVT